MIQPLENGDQLAAAEFLSRCRAMPKLKKAELIEGIVYPLLDLDSAKVLDVLQAGLQTPDHAAFAIQLRAKAPR